MLNLTWIVFGLPFFAAAFIFFFAVNRPKLAGILAAGGLFTGFLLTLTVFFQFLKTDGQALQSSLVWMQLGSWTIEFGILVNGLTLLMLLIVTGIGSLIFLYSMSYMEKDPGYARYFASLSLFAFSMLGIVLANNLIQIFIFWELVGLSSYLLVGFWFEKKEAATAGKKAFITTRVGDVGMMIGILLLFGFMASKGAATFNFLEISNKLPDLGIPASLIFWISIGLFCGVAGKSAQLPLHVWLPDAMEGPTPVSALIHAATMVAAGVFLLARLSFIFDLSPEALTIIVWIGSITAFMAGTIALVQNDIKKILAYSTLSQLGYMVMALGLRDVNAGMFHLATHAFFKALLFLGAGSLIHALHTQDIWKMSGEKGLLRSMPITSWTFLIGTLALMGIPPFSGYFSKEAILAAASHGAVIPFYLSLATVFCTAFYMGRLCTAVFFNQSSSSSKSRAHESGWQITTPLLILAIFSVIAGFFPFSHLIGAREVHEVVHNSFLPVISIALAASGFTAAFFLFRKAGSGTISNPVAQVLEKKYFFDDVYDALIKYVQENLAKAADLFDRFILVGKGVDGTALLVRTFGNTVRKLQTGVVQFYALVFAIGVTVMVYFFIMAGRV